MKKSLLVLAALCAGMVPYAAYAQGTVRGAEEGAAVGEKEAGLVGAVVGGAIGAAAGTIGGILASRSGRGFANTSCVNATRRSGSTRRFASGRCCPKKALRITRFQPSITRNRATGMRS